MGETPVHVEAGAAARLAGDLAIPDNPAGLVLFAHGSGSSRHSPRNRAVAAVLRESGMATLLIDLLTAEEERIDAATAHLRFDIALLARRLGAVIGWLGGQAATRTLGLGLFGASTGGGAALVAAAADPDRVGAVVSRGGRPDLAGPALPRVAAPTLLIVGGDDEVVLDLNREAMRRMTATVRLEVIPGASHLFEEKGALDRVAALAAAWFARYLVPPAA